MYYIHMANDWNGSDYERFLTEGVFSAAKVDFRLYKRIDKITINTD